MLRFSPRDPISYAAFYGTALGSFFLGRYQEGCAWAEKSLQDHPALLHGLCAFAVNARFAGRLHEAQNAVARIREIDPILRVAHLKHIFPINRAEQRAKFDDTLSDLGLPD
jgi:hypothetical protein